MESSILTEITVTLKLSLEEAIWLRDVVQNPIYPDGEEEQLRNKNMRKRFFDALPNPQDVVQNTREIFPNQPK